jgi:SAM-dependent methyltransferase
MNEEAHWNKIAADYNQEIFDVFRSDRKKKLPRYFRKHANKTHSAIDFGCGTGKAFPYIAPVFKRLLAVDISKECLTIAKQRPYSNITFKQLDLSKPKSGLPKADFVFCCNVIMLPEIEKNEVMIQNIQRSLRPGGTGLLVLPSFDSILFSAWRLMDWYRTEGVTPDKIPATEFSYFKGNKRDILRGIVHIDGRLTKHFSQSELEVLFSRAKLQITALEKIEYDWDTEFSSPPSWMGEPYPWDWLVECRNGK